MKKYKISILAGLVILGGLAFLAWYKTPAATHPVPTQILPQPVSADQEHADLIARDNKVFAPQLIKDLHLTGIDVGLVDEASNSYLFDLTDPINGGGVSLIAQLYRDGTFKEVWRGQDYPPCDALDRAPYKVPATLHDADMCFDGAKNIVVR